MKKLSTIFFIWITVISCVACSNDGDIGEELPMEMESFLATVVEVEDVLMVRPLEDEAESKSADLIVVGTTDAKLLDDKGNIVELKDFKEGMTVKIIYDGKIRESYPAQITSSEVQIVVK